jgi:hypothetical protein
LPLPQDYSLEDLVGPQLKFSHNAVIVYGDIAGLMIRLTLFKNTNFDAEAKITLGMSIEEDGRWLINSIH